MDINNYVKTLASLTSWREERSNGLNGCLGVLFVIRNRVKENWQMGDWFRVITAHNQFDSMVRVGDSQTVLYPTPEDPLFTKLLQYIDGVYDGTIEDTLTQGATYYADLQSPGFNKTGWFARVILGNPQRFPRVAQIGTTTYFIDTEKK